MTDLLSKARLDEIKQRCDAATPGPWRLISYEGPQNGYVRTPRDEFFASDDLGTYLDQQCACMDLPDAAFIAAARQDIPDLLADNAELRKRLLEMCDDVDELDRSAVRISLDELPRDLAQRVLDSEA